METYEFTIDAASTDIGTRLDKYLTEQIPDQSRSYIQKLLDDNFITVNGKSAKSNYKLRASDTITVEIPYPPSMGYYDRESFTGLIWIRPDF